MLHAGKSGPGISLNNKFRFSLFVIAYTIIELKTSSILCGGIFVKRPTAIPKVPFNKMFGSTVGKVLGSLRFCL
jgi:hypothetical protein